MSDPNIFFIVGAQRSGTTYLYNLLDKHPEISMAKPVYPEPKFFLQNNSIKKINQYEKTFFKEKLKQKKVYGEKSTSYYITPQVPKRLISAYPNSKTIFILRNPVYRALSHYFFTKSHGLETRSLEAVFLKNEREPAPAFVPCNIRFKQRRIIIENREK